MATHAQSQIYQVRPVWPFGVSALLAIFVIGGCASLVGGGPSGAMGWLPGWAQVSQVQKAEIPAQARTVEHPAATFIVRFDADPVITDICRTFRRDGTGARAKFTRWSTKYPELAGLTLYRASYSGELLLALPHNDPNNRTPKQVLTALQSMDNLAYAELDEIAHPGALDEIAHPGVGEP